MIIRRPDRSYSLKDKLPAINIPTTPIPKEWGPVPGLRAWSVKALSLPLGTIIQDVIDGRPIVAQVQTHYAYGAHPEWPAKPHKGTSVFALAGIDPTTNTLVAFQDPPAGFAQGADSFAGEALGLATPLGHLVEAHGHLPTWLAPTAITITGALLGGPIGASIGLGCALGARWALSR